MPARKGRDVRGHISEELLSPGSVSRAVGNSVRDSGFEFPALAARQQPGRGCRVHLKNCPRLRATGQLWRCGLLSGSLSGPILISIHLSPSFLLSDLLLFLSLSLSLSPLPLSLSLALSVASPCAVFPLEKLWPVQCSDAGSAGRVRLSLAWKVSHNLRKSLPLIFRLKCCPGMVTGWLVRHRKSSRPSFFSIYRLSSADSYHYRRIPLSLSISSSLSHTLSVSPILSLSPAYHSADLLPANCCSDYGVHYFLEVPPTSSPDSGVPSDGLRDCGSRQSQARTPAIDTKSSRI